MTSAAILIYWVIVAVWATVLGVVLYFFMRDPRTFGTTRVLLAVIAIDTTRNIVENVYFGLYFGSRLGAFPPEIATVLGEPILLLMPKALNVVAGVIVLSILLLHWLPRAMGERRAAEERAAHLGVLAATDPLTGLFNRRRFAEIAEGEITRGARYGRPLALLMLDIDHFKSINDRHGHDVGDQVLVALAHLCRSRVRVTDAVARLGGEEFAVLLPETDLEAAQAIAEVLRREIAAHRVPLADSALAMTVSIGIGMTIDGTLDTLLKHADQALYEAKRSGRDRVCTFGAAPALA